MVVVVVVGGAFGYARVGGAVAVKFVDGVLHGRHAAVA